MPGNLFVERICRVARIYSERQRTMMRAHIQYGTGLSSVVLEQQVQALFEYYVLHF